jgi:hypothetical protein
MYEQYFTDFGSIGSAAEVWIDKEKGLVKKFFKPNSLTITKKMPIFQEYSKVKELFENEIYWSTKLKSKLVVETYEYGELKNEPGFYLIQEYLGPDLLHYKPVKEYFPTVVDQLVEMFALFKEHNVYKKNNAMANLTGKNGQIKAFDFKWAVPRSEDAKKYEVNSLHTWLAKIDKDIPSILMEYI